ncbi:MAG: hypothetical protein D6759_20065 [Chloroflexi bacterium]|nr:MAG: hypothetical protein D6759_20065 [Chloroflexota bacterium]
MSNRKVPLPELLRPLFWDTDFDHLRIPDHKQYIIERVLEYGDDEAVRWLWHTFGPSAIADVVRRSRAISPNTANLWALVLSIPREDIRCFSRHFRTTSKSF